MKKLIIALFLFNLISQSFAFHAVTEILPSGKIIICQDYNQLKSGNMVEKMSLKSPHSKSDKTMIKTGEFALPIAGQKIKLIHSDYLSRGKVLRDKHVVELGTAIVSSDSIEGEDRILHLIPRSRSDRQTEKVIKISKEEAMKIQSSCIVAIPEEGLKVLEKVYVKW